MDHFSKWWVISCGFTYFYLMSNHGWWPHIWSPFFRSQVSQNWCCFWPFCPPCTAGHGHGSFASHGGMLSGAWPMQKKRIIFCPEKLPGTWNVCWCPTPYKIGDPTWPSGPLDFRPLSEWPIQRPPQEMPWWNPGHLLTSMDQLYFTPRHTTEVSHAMKIQWPFAFNLLDHVS